MTHADQPHVVHSTVAPGPTGSRPEFPDGPPLPVARIVTLLDQLFHCRRADALPPLALLTALRFLAEPRPVEYTRGWLGPRGLLARIDHSTEYEPAGCTVYEMLGTRLTVQHVTDAAQRSASAAVDSHLFITTEPIDPDVTDHAATLYDTTGTEFAILDCLGFLRHFLHLFHRGRVEYLNVYQSLVLAEPDSAVSLALKEAFLTLRQQAEADG